MQANKQKSTILGIVNRVRGAVSGNVVDSDCLAVSVACSLPKDRDEVVGLVLNGRCYAQAVESADSIALTSEEWETLFGKDAVATRDCGMSAVASSKPFLPHATAIAAALRCSLSEPVAAASWQRSMSKISCYVSLYSDSCEQWINTVLGELVRADARRLDDVRSSAEDNDTDHLMLSQCVLAMAGSVM